jgi:hypothetical protein
MDHQEMLEDVDWIDFLWIGMWLALVNMMLNLNFHKKQGI